ncbi:2-amino-4-hydroxy-6-hydroxymethyldihydropteridine diphosphokinase [Anianabacter salinae]|uniref:2-amino-4-hydroxy-6- hydroxymethyldihydropteridine diphosphokinase n=1 Tax=Anianabacter salinae TaxID=2851023 RepID=UPI00225DE307|nr:2-amino-4-hydroxy-6-hydroxymethyldihydropteridine diphosphokinase [Anianabacter salinae]
MVALGGNQPSEAGSPADTLRAALAEISHNDILVERVSRFFSTPCFPPGAGPDFVNAAVRVRTALTAPDLLAHLHGIEARFGRVRRRRWAERPLDLDLLALGETVLPDAATHARWRDLNLAAQQTTAPDGLILPHPRLHERGFVLIPLCDVAPDWRHPLLGMTAAEMAKQLPDSEKAGIIPL